MINRWEQGRDSVDLLIRQGRLSQVASNRELAEANLAQARVHLIAAATVRDLDPAGAFTLSYDAARLALTSLLVNQGLRPRGDGTHAVLLEVALAQLEPPRQKEIREFDWMRRLRNDTQYPDVGRPSANADDVDQAITAAQPIIDRVARLVDVMPPY